MSGIRLAAPMLLPYRGGKLLSTEHRRRAMEHTREKNDTYFKRAPALASWLHGVGVRIVCGYCKNRFVRADRPFRVPSNATKGFVLSSFSVPPHGGSAV